MRIPHALLLCILGALLSPVVCNNASGPDDCCFKYYPRRLREKLIKSYYMTDYQCPKVGVILVTQASRHICVDPNIPWVERVMKMLDERFISTK